MIDRIHRTGTLLVVATLALATPIPAQVQVRTQSPGARVIGGMHDAYAGTRFTTVAFVQRTIFPGGVVQTWYEAMDLPGKLRIDTSPDSMNALIFRNDSIYVFRGGQRVRAGALVHPLLLMLDDVYYLPPETTAARLTQLGVDLSNTHETTYDGRPTIVIGAAAGDTTSSQVWIDRERLYTVRMIQSSAGGQGNVRETLMQGWTRQDGGWFESLVIQYNGGQLAVREKYRDIRVGVTHEPGLFDVDTYRPAAWIGTARDPARLSPAPGSAPASSRRQRFPRRP